MTILCCVEGPGLQLIVCGTPSAEWLEWLDTTSVGLTEGQLAWRELRRRATGAADAPVDDSADDPGEARGTAVAPPDPPAARRARPPRPRFDLVDTDEL